MRNISASTGNSRLKVSEIIQMATEKGIAPPLAEEMTDSWLEKFLFPGKTRESKGRELPDLDFIHKVISAN